MTGSSVEGIKQRAIDMISLRYHIVKSGAGSKGTMVAPAEARVQDQV
jgi:hypothetical protein